MEKRKTVLIIEDEKVNRRILRKLLQEQYDVVEATNGQEGWELLSKNRKKFSAILLDVVMPVMSGYEFLDKIREAGIKDLPIIVTTGAADGELEQEVLAAGAWDFVTRPYNIHVLLGRLRNAIARSQVALYEQMQKMAAHDPLIGLHNRGRMFEQTRQMMDDNPGKQFVFLRFDIDHFALFNTSFGEMEGNKLLKFLARCLEELAGTVELYKYCRMNSDVFCACLVYDGHKDQLEEKVNAVQEKLFAYKKDYLLSLSVGVYIVEDTGLSIEDMYFRATVAAKKCKNQYENNLAFYDAATGERIANEIIIQNEMQAALDAEQFVVYLQPKFRVSTETICGSEALVRWAHPTKGMISPGEFIPVFENNGFISKLDYYVWEKTCAMLSKWTNEGRTPYPVSVNISRISLYNPSLTKLLVDLVSKYQIAPSLLQLEITESAYMSNPELMESTMHSLHEAGFVILMDDFGSGYSSLNTLKHIYIDVLKIDMKFLPVDNDSERGEIILACIIKMANLLGMSVITEGVETRKQRDFLEGAGCDFIQGYYYSRPIPQEEYESRYLSDQKRENDEMVDYYNIEETNIIPKQNATVLVIDDSECEREIIRQNLQEMYHVHLCDNVEAALAYLKKNMSKVRMILVDNLMSGMSGLDFLKYCRINNALNAIPKIMITANDTVEDQVEAFQAGAYDFLAKPLTKEILLARVGHAMSISSKTFEFNAIEAEYRHVYERDAATELLNKTAFRELASRVLQISSENGNSLMVIDIDDFKHVNDEYGHLAGDKVIRCVADELKSAFRKSDIIGRFGGDEFVVLMTQIPNHEVAKRKASEVIKAVLFTCSNQLNIQASISIGIAFSDSEDTEEALFARADQALYEAKNTGKGRAVVYGEKVPPIQDDNKPVVLVCSENPQLYPTIALAYGNSVGFSNVTNYSSLVNDFSKYGKRIRAICLDMQKKDNEDSDQFYQYIEEHGGGVQIPILAFCKEGNIRQMRDALKLNIMDMLSLPPHLDTIQQRLTMAIMKSGFTCK